MPSGSRYPTGESPGARYSRSRRNFQRSVTQRRPPLSWDSLMYHLLLTATWLQERNLKPVFGPYPVNDYGYVPANGSVWVWW